MINKANNLLRKMGKNLSLATLCAILSAGSFACSLLDQHTIAQEADRLRVSRKEYFETRYSPYDTDLIVSVTSLAAGSYFLRKVKKADEELNKIKSCYPN